MTGGTIFKETTTFLFLNFYEFGCSDRKSVDICYIRSRSTKSRKYAVYPYCFHYQRSRQRIQQGCPVFLVSIKVSPNHKAAIGGNNLICQYSPSLIIKNKPWIQMKKDNLAETSCSTNLGFLVP